VSQLLSLVFVVLLLGSPFANAGEVPQLVGRVSDYANVLSVEERADLEKTLRAYETETTHQIAVLTVQSLRGESIEDLSSRVANAWGLGQKGLDNGVLVTLAPAERAVRIELGTGMSKYVSDDEAKRIIDETMIPAFRTGDIKGGLRRGVVQLREVCRAYKIAKQPK
jgi:uncharacterized protein